MPENRPLGKSEIEIVLFLKEKIDFPPIDPKSCFSEKEARKVYINRARAALRNLEDPAAKQILSDAIMKYLLD